MKKTNKEQKAINKYDGEIKLKLYGVDYPMRWTAKVYAQFKSETGVDPHALFMDVINEINVMKSIGIFEKEVEPANSELMARLSGIVHAEYAAWLFFLAAKQMDSMVSFDEIQEAVLLEGVSQHKMAPDEELVQTYPYLVAEFAIFAFNIGNVADDGDSKKKNLKPSFLQKLLHQF